MNRFFIFFFFNDTATTEIYTLSLHDALPILRRSCCRAEERAPGLRRDHPKSRRSEEHTSELQSRSDLVCRLLLEKKTTAVRRSARLDLRQVGAEPQSVHEASSSLNLQASADS